MNALESRRGLKHFKRVSIHSFLRPMTRNLNRCCAASGPESRVVIQRVTIHSFLRDRLAWVCKEKVGGRSRAVSQCKDFKESRFTPFYELVSSLYCLARWFSDPQRHMACEKKGFTAKTCDKTRDAIGRLA